MKKLLVIFVLLLQFGCSSNNTDHLRYKYHLLEFNMPVDVIIDVIGTPDIKIPELIGETWFWSDQEGMNRIAVYISPQATWNIPATDHTPRVTLDTGRLIYKKWLNDGESI